jgi:hypothetical protein
MTWNSFYRVGGTLPPDAPSYVERAADCELFRRVRVGEFCYVLSTRQMGKSSLMVRTARRLRDEGAHAAIVDLTLLGTSRETATAEQWYFGIADAIFERLGLDADLDAWWDRRSGLPPTRRLVQFLRDVVMARTSGPVVVFIDEIDSTLGLPFTADFFAALRACYNARAEDPAFRRLTFVLLGVASPSDLIADTARTPFNIGTRIDLTDFTPDEARPLARGLGGDPAGCEQVLRRVLEWTDGHPYLTQHVCRLAAVTLSRVTPEEIDGLIDREFLAPGASRRNDNLKFVHNRVAGRGRLTRRMLRVYRRVLRGENVVDDAMSPVHVELKLAGIVKTRGGDGTLAVRNRIYCCAFGAKWVAEV